MNPTKTRSVAIVGAGISGLRCAESLQQQGFTVTIFEKSRGPSGRVSTRRVPEFRQQFDHGAQYFTARSPAFSTCVARWVQHGVAAQWNGRFGTLDRQEFVPRTPLNPRFVGTPRMSVIGRYLSKELSVKANIRIQRAEKIRSDWWLTEDNNERHGPFDCVVVAVPGPQAVPLLSAAPAMVRRIQNEKMVPCLALMLHFSHPLPAGFDAASVTNGPFSWLALDSSKPGRLLANCWVAHTDEATAISLLEEPIPTTTTTLVRAFREELGITANPETAVVHRWRYARRDNAPGINPAFLYDPELRIGICGGWLTESRVEAAWVSGSTLAQHIGKNQP